MGGKDNPARQYLFKVKSIKSIYMNIDRVTISGADDKVSVDEMLEIQREFPFVEWGILISRKRMGTNRYPSKEWLRKLHHDLNISFHLCGYIVREFVQGKHSVVWEAGLNWQRVQLNFSFKEPINYAPTLLDISDTARNTPDRSFVLAYNKGSKSNLDRFIQNHVSMPSNIHFLYDSSGGRGAEIKYLQKPLLNYTGYAGGLNPENVGTICECLDGMEWSDKVWIDMETGVRTGDQFDLKKVREVLTIANTFISNQTV